MTSDLPVYSRAMFAASSSSDMVQSVSMSSVRPWVRNSTPPDAKPTTAAVAPAAIRLVIGSFQIPCLASIPTV